MTKPKEINAKIIATRLGIEANVFTYWVRVIYIEKYQQMEMGQAFGGIRLDGEFKEGDKSPANVLLGIIEAAEATCWEDLVGRFLRIRYTTDRIIEVGHLTEDDKWVKV